MVERMPKKFWERGYGGIIEADAYVWWQETYGMGKFRLEFLSENRGKRMAEYWVTDRAKKFRARVLPPGIKLSDQPLAP